MAPRFGATKFRNAVPAIPPRDQWYRTHLPSASDAPANTSSFSSVVKTNREWVVTLSPSGDASVRAYASVGEREAEVWNGRLGTVLDWDLSRLEDGGMVVAGGDGSIAYYTISGTADEVHRFSTPGKITSIALHPTTAGLAASSSPETLAVWDVSASTAALKLNSPGNQALWTVSWSADGRLLGGVSRKGVCGIWDPRAGADPVQKRDVSTMLQALKPVRAAFVDSDLFVTSFSRSRARQYSLLAGDGLGTLFTAQVDNSQGPLMPLVDAERRIVYAAGRGDMTLRQIELQGPQGYQEMTHPLPAPLTSGSLAAAHWSTLPVMQAQIASIIVPTTDKDGETLLPVAVKVPRRFLIDYHEDLYPDVPGSVPEQDAAEWLGGEDRRPLPASINPERRGEWERAVASGKEKWAGKVGGGSKAPPSETPAEPTPAPAAQRSASTASAPADLTSLSSAAPPVERTATPMAAPRQPPPPTIPPAAASSASTDVNPDLPPLENGEDYTSTSYKVRQIGKHILACREEQKQFDKGPLMVGLQGPQGCGKTTLCDALLAYLRDKGQRVGVLSLDDLYRTHDGLVQVAKDHPSNGMLSGRGLPGTHDVELATSVLSAVSDINVSGDSVALPVFDKSLCGGAGDRSSETVTVTGPLDVFVLEGWSMGFGALSPAELERRYAAKDGKYFPRHSLESLAEVNDYLAAFARDVYPPFSAMVQVEPTSNEHVFAWRLEQEHSMKAKNGGKGMTDDQVHAFIERYMPAYELWAAGVDDPKAPWSGNVLRLKYGAHREVLGIETPAGAKEGESSAPASNGKAEGRDVAAAKVSTPETQPVAKAAPSPSRSSPTRVASPPSRSSPATAVSAAPAAISAAATPTPATTSAAASTPATATATTAPAAATPSAPFHPTWSRKYISGKSPLNPTYFEIPPVETLHQDSLILHVTPHHLLFPIQGPGGRVCVHPRARKGRVPGGGVGYLSAGVGVADFATDPFSDAVVLAGEDGVLRLWHVPAAGIEGPGPEPAVVMRGERVDKIVQIAFHPTAAGLLVAASNEYGSASLRFFDTGRGEEVKRIELGARSVHNFAISPAGDRIAVTAKDGRVLVVDPRTGSTVEGNVNTSPRALQLAWVDATHVVSLGFGRGSVRKVALHAVDDSVHTVADASLDVSPAVLFPVYDPDTAILYVWGKGERAIHAYHVAPGGHGEEALAKLPSFSHASGAPQLALAFDPKTSLDVKSVQVARALRLTARTVEEVTFTIPRNRKEFFQDDIYVPMRVGPATTAARWLDGDDGEAEMRDLRPEDMTPLSQAPAIVSTRTKFVPAAKVMSEEEQKQAAMDRLFAKAQLDDSSDEEEVVRGVAPPDDDWD